MKVAAFESTLLTCSHWREIDTLVIINDSPLSHNQAYDVRISLFLTFIRDFVLCLGT